MAKRVRIQRMYNCCGKRLIDLAICLLGLPLTLPLMAVITIAIRLTSHGPALLSLPSYGRHGRIFSQYRFRTVRIPRKKGDEVVSAPLGAFLIDTGLNRLPQLLNVLLGQMSLVGPSTLHVAQLRGFPVTSDMFPSRPALFFPDSCKEECTMTIEERLSINVAYQSMMSPCLDMRIILINLRP